MNTIRNSICLTIITMVLCGFLFPLAITLIGQIFFYQQANGSLITYDNRIVGSKIDWTALDRDTIFSRETECS